MFETKEEKKEESLESEKVHNDLNAMNIIHELAESTNIQAATHKKDAETNQLYAKANVLLVQTNNDLSKSIINLNNYLSHNRISDAADTDKLSEKLIQMEKRMEELKQKIEKIEAMSEKLDKLLPSILYDKSKWSCEKINGI